MSAPTPGTAVTQGDTATSTDTVVSFTTAAGETYMLVFVGIKGVNMSSVQAVTFGATSLSPLKDQLDGGNNSIRGVLYGGVVPDSTTANVTVDYLGGNANGVVAIVAFSGVDSVGTAVANVSSGSTSTVALSGVDGDTLTVDFIVTAAGDNNPTADSGQVALFTRFNDGASIVEMDGTSEVGESNPGWSNLSHGNDQSIEIGIPLHGVASGGGVVPQISMHRFRRGRVAA